MRFLKSQILLRLANSFFIDSPQPSNLSYLWNFGSLLGLCLVFQILTGIFLAMNLCVAVKSHYMLETSKALITILVFFFQTLAFDGKWECRYSNIRGLESYNIKDKALLSA